MNTFTFVFLSHFYFFFNTIWLAKRQADYVAVHRSAVPDAFKSKVPLTAHQKSR